MTYDPVRVCAVLNEEGVDYVVVGGLAAVVHGSSLPTSDVDVLPDRAPANLERLARALRRLGARIRTDADPVEVPLSGPFLAEVGLTLNLTTDHGDVDLTFEPSGPRDGYHAWAEDAVVVEIGPGVSALVASLDDVIASKRAAGRPKDERALPYLESLRDELRRRDTPRT